MYYFLTCLAALLVSVAISMAYHRAFHRWNPWLDPVGYCGYQRHGWSFRLFSALAFAPFLLVANISPYFLEYQKNGFTVYQKMNGVYQKVTWATWDDPAVLNVPLGEHQPRTGFTFFAENNGKIREATVGIGFSYDPDPEVYEQVFRAGGYDFGHNFGSPNVKRLIFGFMIRNEDEIKKLAASINLASPTSREEFEKKMRSFVGAHLQHPGMSFSVFWADIREF